MTKVAGGADVPWTPEQVAVAASVLSHEECPVNGELLGMGGGKVDRIFLTDTGGIVDLDLTPERLLASWHQVMSTDDYWIPKSWRTHADSLRQDRGAVMLRGREVLPNVDSASFVS